MKDMAIPILKAGFRMSNFFSHLGNKIKGERYLEEVCNYLAVDRSSFFHLVKEAEKLSDDFYDKQNAVSYICYLVYYNRIQNNRDTSWIQISRIVSRYHLPSLLDFGCGAGCLIQYLKEKNNKFISYGYDTSSKTLEFAKRRLEDTIFLDDVNEKASFDIVACISVLEHLPLEACWRTVTLLEKVTRHCLIVNFVTGKGLGHIKDTQEHLKEIENFLDNHFNKKTILWTKDVFAYER